MFFESIHHVDVVDYKILFQFCLLPKNLTTHKTKDKFVAFEVRFLYSWVASCLLLLLMRSIFSKHFYAWLQKQTVRIGWVLSTLVLPRLTILSPVGKFGRKSWCSFRFGHARQHTSFPSSVSREFQCCLIRDNNNYSQEWSNNNSCKNEVGCKVLFFIKNHQACTVETW